MALAIPEYFMAQLQETETDGNPGNVYAHDRRQGLW